MTISLVAFNLIILDFYKITVISLRCKLFNKERGIIF